jgi:hypothetical protein
MTAEESRALKIGDRVYWRDDPRDQGTVTASSWAGVEIKSDNSAKAVGYYHNDIGPVTKVHVVRW